MRDFPAHDIVFWFCAFFLSGILAKTSGISCGVLLVCAAIFSLAFFLIFLLYDKRRFFIFCFFPLVAVGGFFYVQTHSFLFTDKPNITFGEKIKFSGTVKKVLSSESRQIFIVSLKKPSSGDLLITSQPYPAVFTGASIEFEGKAFKPKTARPQLAVSGEISFPLIISVSKPENFSLRYFLALAKNKSLENIQKSMTKDGSALMGGILLGDTTKFSKELKENMKKSGTTHLVALSGYNITILIISLGSFFLFVFGWRFSFWALTLCLFLFIIMTGAEPSVVRAGIMGFLALLALKIGRQFHFRNSAALAAFGMALHDPSIIRFDIGFQLSFLALMGISYLAPAMSSFFEFFKEEGFLSWKKNLLATFCAQAAVLPILLSYFGKLPIASLAANVLVLSLMPLTMLAGFVIAAAGFISPILAIIAGWVSFALLKYELGVIYFFAKFPQLSLSKISVIFFIAYYSVLVLLTIAASRLRPHEFKRATMQSFL